MRVRFASATRLCLRFINVILLALSRAYFLLPAYIYLRVLSCTCFSLVTAMHAQVYCVACESEEIMQYNSMETAATSESE